jgi:hypothetical protein
MREFAAVLAANSKSLALGINTPAECALGTQG